MSRGVHVDFDDAPSGFVLFLCVVLVVAAGGTGDVGIDRRPEVHWQSEPPCLGSRGPSSGTPIPTGSHSEVVLVGAALLGVELVVSLVLDVVDAVDAADAETAVGLVVAVAVLAIHLVVLDDIGVDVVVPFFTTIL